MTKFEWKWYAGDGSQAVTIHPSSYMFSAPWMGVGAGQWNTTGLPQSETGLGWLCYRDITPAPNSVEYIFSTDCVRLTINVPFQ